MRIQTSPLHRSGGPGRGQITGVLAVRFRPQITGVLAVRFRHQSTGVLAVRFRPYTDQGGPARRRHPRWEPAPPHA